MFRAFAKVCQRQDGIFGTQHMIFNRGFQVKDVGWQQLVEKSRDTTIECRFIVIHQNVKIGEPLRQMPDRRQEP